MIDAKFYYCEHCGNMMQGIFVGGAPVMCCGRKMILLQPGTVDASHEKHIPVVEVKNGLVAVEVGEVAHPMTDEHSILWVYLQTDRGGHMKHLQAGEAPEAVFALHNEKPIAAFAYCNLHGLWKTDL